MGRWITGFLRKLLNRLSIKVFLTGTISLLVLLLLAFSVSHLLKTRTEGKEMARMEAANTLVDKIIEASGYLAKERGITAMSLSSDRAIDAAALRTIEELRAKSGQTTGEAYATARKLSTLDGGNSAIETALNRAAAALEALEDGRKSADAALRRAEDKGYVAKDWTRVITAFIDANSDIRATAFAGAYGQDANFEGLRYNLELKQAVWLVSEYAGRERALVARLVSSNIPFDTETSGMISTHRAIVDINLRPILRLKEDPAASKEVLDAIAEMEESFLGRFEETRKEVFSASSTGNYQISGDEWVRRSSEAIDSILAVSAAVGNMVDAKIAPEAGSAKWNSTAAMVIMALIAAVGACAIFVINTKVIEPMHSLKNKMAEIERSGDLTVKIESVSDDESGQMAETFNRMIGNFHGVVAQIHQSVTFLSSSAEELSAASLQIEKGTSTQSSRALQVSTASNEMSATVGEIARNVVSASEASREASAVAERGGSIVLSSIEAMEGIAETAKGSSAVISSLAGSSKDIGSIITVIEDIADQTNLLALNAAIEAARAGDHGRGFAVVADEVKKLAEKTIGATREIDAKIRAMQEGISKAALSMNSEIAAVRKGTDLARETGDAIKEIISRSTGAATLIESITVALEQQSSATEQISADVENVSGVASETLQSASQIATASREIAKLAAELKANIEVFKVSSSERAHKTAGPDISSVPQSKTRGARAA